MQNKLLTLAAVGALAAAPAFAETPVPPAHELRPAAAPVKSATTGNAPSANALSTAQGRLAVELIEKLANKPSETNTIVSPASLASAFALVGEGADAEMKKAIAKALGFSVRDAAQAFASLNDARRALAVDNGDLFQFADRLVLAPGSDPSPELLARLEALGAKPSILDLSKLEAVAEIDGWVKETTNGAIPELLGAPLDKPAFVALNALRFKGKWKTPFDPQLTAPAPFKGLDGKSVEVPMMRLTTAQRSYRADKSFIGVDLPFSNDRFSLVVVTTLAKPASAKDFSKIGDWLTGAGFESRKGDLALPRFRLDGRADLLPALDALGLKEARRSPSALVAFGKGAMLSQILQRAMIEIDEEGAEAAAATAIMSTRSIETDDAIHMTVDKPFVFALRDSQNGVILVAGYVTNPTVAAEPKRDENSPDQKDRNSRQID